jgi:hypothetical protein
VRLNLKRKFVKNKRQLYWKKCAEKKRRRKVLLKRKYV